MDIALYHPWLKSKGGAEKVLLEVLKRSEHDVTLYTLYHDPDATFQAFENHDVEVVGSNRAPGGFLSKAVRFGFGSVPRKLPVEKHDALVVSEAGLGSLIALRNRDTPVHCYCHTPLRAALPSFRQTYRKELSVLARPLFDIGVRIYNVLERKAWRHFDRVMANSELTRERIVGKGLADAGDVEVVHPGVDLDRFAQGQQGDYFLYPSRFRRYKRQDLAVEAFERADLDGFRLVLAGAGQEEDYVRELRERTAGNDSIEIMTDVDDEVWKDLYADAYAVLFLAEQEDWGMVPVEAMASGKPLVAVDEGGFTDAVEDGETGLLVPPDADAVAGAMESLAADPERAGRMGEAGLAAAQDYSWDAFIDRFDGVVA